MSTWASVCTFDAYWEWWIGNDSYPPLPEKPAEVITK